MPINMPSNWAAIKGDNGKLTQPSLRDKFRIAALLRDEKEPTDQINAILKDYKRSVTKGKTGQLKGYARTIEKLMRAGDQEAIKLGTEFGFFTPDEPANQGPATTEPTDADIQQIAASVAPTPAKTEEQEQQEFYEEVISGVERDAEPTVG